MSSAAAEGAAAPPPAAAEEVVSVELPAPPGWKKKFIPKKGGTPKRNEIELRKKPLLQKPKHLPMWKGKQLKLPTKKKAVNETAIKHDLVDMNKENAEIKLRVLTRMENPKKPARSILLNLFHIQGKREDNKLVDLEVLPPVAEPKGDVSSENMKDGELFSENGTNCDDGQCQPKELL
uniref:Uncharacterized protein n=1 Tax=Ananas comosus var. bracteatus TaxID=296719 RepID=A0A6V7PB54_ANACO|nr:unnamed protein product [Ananas comosus var. bracteatus]